MAFNTDYENHTLRGSATAWPRGFNPVTNPSIRRVWISSQDQSILLLSSLQGRVTSLKSIAPAGLLDPNSTINEIELVLMDWEERAEPGENREDAKDAIMRFLWNPTLKDLQLTSYKLKELPEIWNVRWIAERLTILNLSDNQLQYLPATFKELKFLKYLSLEKNCLVELPKAISNFKFLKWLNIANNPALKAIPDLQPGCSIQISRDVLNRNEVGRLKKFHTIYTK